MRSGVQHALPNGAGAESVTPVIITMACRRRKHKLAKDFSVDIVGQRDAIVIPESFYTQNISISDPIDIRALIAGSPMGLAGQ
jgi:hypothetical protein